MCVSAGVDIALWGYYRNSNAGGRIIDVKKFSFIPHSGKREVWKWDPFKMKNLDLILKYIDGGIEITF